MLKLLEYCYFDRRRWWFRRPRFRKINHIAAPEAPLGELKLKNEVPRATDGPSSQIAIAHFRSEPCRIALPGDPAVIEQIKPIRMRQRECHILLGEE